MARIPSPHRVVVKHQRRTRPREVRRLPKGLSVDVPAWMHRHRPTRSFLKTKRVIRPSRAFLQPWGW